MGEYGDYEQGFAYRCPETGDKVHVFPRDLWHDPDAPLSMRFRHKTPIPPPSSPNPPFKVNPCERIAEKYQAPILLFNHLYAKNMAKHSAPKSSTGSLASGSVACKTVTSVHSSGNSSSVASCRDPFHEPFHKAPRPDVNFDGYRKPSPTLSNESRLFNGFSGAYSHPKSSTQPSLESSTQQSFTQSSSRRPSRFQDLRPLSEQSSTQQSFTQQSLSQRSSTQRSSTMQSFSQPSATETKKSFVPQTIRQSRFQNTLRSVSEQSSTQQSFTRQSFSQQSATKTRQSLTRQSTREASPARRQPSRPHIFVKEIDHFPMGEHGPIFEDSPSQMEENEADDSLIVRCINKLGIDWNNDVFSLTRNAVSWSWRKVNAIYRHSTRKQLQHEAEQRRLAAEAQWRQDEQLRVIHRSKMRTRISADYSKLSTVPESFEGESDEEPDSESASVSSSVLRECDRKAAARGKEMAINDLKMMYMRDRAPKPLPKWDFLSDKDSDYTEVTDGNSTIISIASTFVSYVGSTVSSAASKLSGWLGFSK